MVERDAADGAAGDRLFGLFDLGLGVFQDEQALGRGVGLKQTGNDHGERLRVEENDAAATNESATVPTGCVMPLAARYDATAMMPMRAGVNEERGGRGDRLAVHRKAVRRG